MKDCLFCKIARKEIPAEFVYEDEDIAVFEDKNPKAPLHLLFVPKEHVEELGEAKDMIVLSIKKKIADIVGERWLIEKGYRVVVNGGTARAVPHLHFHLLGGVDVGRNV